VSNCGSKLMGTKGKGSVNGTPSHSYRVSLAIWDHTVLAATWHKWAHPTLTTARQIYLSRRYGRLSWSTSFKDPLLLVILSCFLAPLQCALIIFWEFGTMIFINHLITGWAIAQTCCISQYGLSIGKVVFSATPGLGAKPLKGSPWNLGCITMSWTLP